MKYYLLIKKFRLLLIPFTQPPQLKNISPRIKGKILCISTLQLDKCSRWHGLWHWRGHWCTHRWPRICATLWWGSIIVIIIIIWGHVSAPRIVTPSVYRVRPASAAASGKALSPLFVDVDMPIATIATPRALSCLKLLANWNAVDRFIAG